MKRRKKQDYLYEKTLIEKSKKDKKAFGELYDRYIDKIYNFVYYHVDYKEVAEDSTSEIFERALANLDNFKQREVPFSAWLYKIAKNKIIDHYRKKKDVLLDDQKSANLKDKNPGPEKLLYKKQRKKNLRTAVSSLPFDQKQAVILRYQEEMKIKEIAKILDRSEGAVKLLLNRAIKNLRRELNGQI